MGILGIDAVPVTVEVNIANRGIPSFDVVGLPAKTVAESRHRIRAAFNNSGYVFPSKKITVNLAPADIKKEGSFYDLPIAVGIICATQGVSIPKDTLFFGELSLTGELRHTKGALLLSLLGKTMKYKNIVIPEDCYEEASAVKGINTCGFHSLQDLVAYLKNTKPHRRVVSKLRSALTTEVTPDFDSIYGQLKAKRALEIAAAGGHNILLLGAPGTGKSYMAKSFSGILPSLTESESLEVTKIYSSGGFTNKSSPIITRPPFRSPHHTVSLAAMLGGGPTPHAGEVTLSHRGVLFMDEFCEFRRDVVESLRQPLQDKYIVLNRLARTFIFPANFILIAATNPCPCGYRNHPTKSCVCSISRQTEYLKKLSGPLIDRIDLWVTMSNDDIQGKTFLANYGESSRVIANRVKLARHKQYERTASSGSILNANLADTALLHACNLDTSSLSLLDTASKKYGLSMRAYFKVLKIARTIADLELSVDTTSLHIAEALQFRETP